MKEKLAYAREENFTLRIRGNTGKRNISLQISQLHRPFGMPTKYERYVQLKIGNAC